MQIIFIIFKISNFILSKKPCWEDSFCQIVLPNIYTTTAMPSIEKTTRLRETRIQAVFSDQDNRSRPLLLQIL
jgi:hypothetical protein